MKPSFYSLKALWDRFRLDSKASSSLPWVLMCSLYLHTPVLSSSVCSDVAFPSAKPHEELGILMLVHVGSSFLSPFAAGDVQCELSLL